MSGCFGRFCPSPGCAGPSLGLISVCFYAVASAHVLLPGFHQVSIRSLPCLKTRDKTPLFLYILFLDKIKVSETCNKLSINLDLIHSAEICGIIPRQEKSSAYCLSKFPFLIVSS